MKARINKEGILEVLWDGEWLEQNCIIHQSNECCGVRCPALTRWNGLHLSCYKIDFDEVKYDNQEH